MIIISIIIMLLIIVLCNCCIKDDKITKKIVTSYSIIMFMLMILSMLNPVELYNVSNYTYVLLGLNIICTTIPIIIVSIKSKNKNIKEDKSIDYNSIVKSKFFLILEIFECIILVYYLIKYLNIISNIPTNQIRIARFELLFDGAFETLFYNYIVSGILTISTLLFAILLVNKKIKNPLFIIITINIILFTFIGFGRMTIFTVFILIFFTILITKDVKKMINTKNLLKLSIIVIITFLCFSSIIFVRMRDSKQSIKENMMEAINNQFNQIFEYFLGGIRMLDNFVQNGFKEFPTYTYGRATLAGVDEIVLYPLKGIGLEINSFNNMATDIMSRASAIGENTPYYNAFYTGIMNFYLDFGTIGVILFSILHGFLIAFAIQYYREKNNIYSLMLLIYSLKNLILMILHWEYQSGSTTLELIVLIIINIIVSYKEKEKEKNENTLDS